MARDYAKGNRRRTSTRRKPSNRRKSTKRSTASRGSAVRSYFAGLLSGLFISFLIYLATLPSDNIEIAAEPPTPQPKPAEPEVDFKFWDKLKEQRVEVDVRAVEPAADVSKPRVTATPEVFLLQAGAFSARADADSRRAELIILGLEPTIQETIKDGKRWYRVHLGPFETSAAMNKAMALTASAGITTFKLKRPGN